MLFRLFLISTLLLFGITTVAIGAPVAETVEGIKAVKIPQMRYGNLTLNRRFINGIPGNTQCVNKAFPLLISSSCVNGETIQAICGNTANLNTEKSHTDCADGTTCKDFKTGVDPVGPVDPPANFALCVNNEQIKTFDNNRRAGIVCNDYRIIVTQGTATISVNVYDVDHNPIQVRNIEINMNGQAGTSQDTTHYSRILDVQNNDQIARVCVNIVAGAALIVAMFSYLDGTYSNSK